MNDKIINNLFELWKHVGQLANRLTVTQNYSAVSLINSDWPNRIFDIIDSSKTLEEVLKLSQLNKLPEILTIEKPNDIGSNSNLAFVMGQKNMALDLKLVSNNLVVNPNIKQVKTEKDSINFAQTASKSFGYRVDPKIIGKIVDNSKTIRLYIYQENTKCLGCGIVFFDSNNNAGLHMIGTLPEGRGRGIGKNMTEKLLLEAKQSNANYCILHASLMGETIYKKLGFELYGEIETFRILKSK